MSDAKRKKYDEKVERAIAGQLSSQLAGKIPNSKWGEEKPSKKTKVIPVEDDDEKGKEEKAGKKRGEKQAGHFYGSGEKMPAKETKEKKDKKEEKEKKEKKKKGDESPEKGRAKKKIGHPIYDNCTTKTFCTTITTNVVKMRTYDDVNDKHQREEEEEDDVSVDMAPWSV
ncbi:hypothetical protein AK812_SmicGene24326 [Symbiodinium microadriaticum]|uniref:Uncharacterized protein n=1 Tax=Symbiodinium microadriaticum TaxID=2951 RepID=A0A1Q9DF52_SYMMI|nr:hypothetical protein AK812_SmicGene24326 [Symbiodinium microadriaticum]CAE7909204.1 unnamed protein product [Symbiodinium microadriaticum]